MAELDDIFSNEQKKLSDEELLKYLDGNASDEEMHAIERKMSDSPFDSEALEGLEHFNHKESLNDYVQQLNKNLQQQLKQKNQQKEKRKIKDLPLAILTVIIILVLCVLGYFVIHFFQQSRNAQAKPAPQQSTIVYNPISKG